MLIMLIVMCYPCKHILFYLVDHGNLIKKYVHHGRKNQYTLAHKDKNITLLPVSREDIMKVTLLELVKEKTRAK